MSARQILVVQRVEAEGRLRLSLTVELSLKVPDPFRCCWAHRQSPGPRRLRKHARSQGPSLHRHYPASAVLRPCPTPAEAASATLRPLPSPTTGLPRLPASPFQRAVPITPADRTGASVDYFPVHTVLPRISAGSTSSIMDFEACSGFTRVTARWIARPPEAAFVTRLRPVQLPVQAARQLPDQSTTLWAEPSSAGDARLRGAPKRSSIRAWKPHTTPIIPRTNCAPDRSATRLLL